MGPLGGSWGPLGGSWERFWRLLGSLWGLLGSLWGLLGTLGEIFGATWGVFGSFRGPSACQKVPQGIPREAQVATKTVAERVVSPMGFPMQFKAYFQRVFESRAQAWECVKCTKTLGFYSILSRSPFPRAKQSSHKRKHRKSFKIGVLRSKIEPKSGQVRLKSHAKVKIVTGVPKKL